MTRQFTLFGSSARPARVSPPRSDSGSGSDRFEEFVALAAERTSGPGVTLEQVGDADALARELEKPEPDTERVDLLSGRLGLEPESLR